MSRSSYIMALIWFDFTALFGTSYTCLMPTRISDDNKTTCHSIMALPLDQRSASNSVRNMTALQCSASALLSSACTWRFVVRARTRAHHDYWLVVIQLINMGRQFMHSYCVSALFSKEPHLNFQSASLFCGRPKFPNDQPLILVFRRIKHKQR